MPTLLSINNYHYRRGGADAVFLDHNDLFRQNGWNVVPFAMEHDKNLDSEWSGNFVEEVELGNRYGLLDTVRKATKSVYSFEARRKVRGLITAAQPAIAHGHNIYHHLSPSILGAIKACGLPVVLTLHDLKIACPAYKMMTHDGICERCKSGRLDNVLWHRCVHSSLSVSALVFVEAVLHRLLRSYRRYVDMFVVPSRFYLDKFVEWGWAADRFRYIPNFVDFEDLQPDFQPGRTFVYFGRLSAEKGIGTLIKAAAAAGADLQIAGTGPYEDELRALAERLGSNAQFMGYQSGEALHDLVRSARAVILPSEWYENAPISVLEAYALGTPVIGARIGGIPELITEGETGWTFEAFSHEALASVIRTVAEQPDEKLVMMGRAARDWVAGRFSRQAYFDRCADLYRELL